MSTLSMKYFFSLFRINVTIEIDTTTVQGFLFSAHVQHQWPDVIRKCRAKFKFPLTQIGNTTVSGEMENVFALLLIIN